MTTQFSIGEVAQRTNYRVGMIRYFEKAGVISAPRRTTGNLRVFTPLHVEELRFVSKMQRLGFYTRQIRELREIKQRRLADAEKREAVTAILEQHRRYVVRKMLHFTRVHQNLEEAAPCFVDSVLGDWADT